VKKKPSGTFGLGSIVQDEVQLRKKESIGLALAGNQKLGGTGKSHTAKADHDKVDDKNENKAETWGCHVCTLSNKPRHLTCLACGTARRDSAWVGAP